MPHTKINIIGCGYIGKKVVRSLVELKQDTCCFVKTENSKEECEASGHKVFQFDLDKEDLNIPDDIKQKFNKSSIAYFSPPPPKGEIDTRINFFISSLKKLDTTPEKIILISTTGVYGDCSGDWIDESRALNPQADRARRRVSAEKQLQEYCENKKIPYVIFRVPGIYAADKLPVKRISSGDPIVCAEDSGYTNRIHADDLAAFCVEALNSEVTTGIYNCCDGHPSTMNDYFMKVADALGLDRPREISLQQAQGELSAGMLSYLAESKRISNKKLLDNFNTEFMFADLEAGLLGVKGEG